MPAAASRRRQAGGRQGPHSPSAVTGRSAVGSLRLLPAGGEVIAHLAKDRVDSRVDEDLEQLAHDDAAEAAGLPLGRYRVDAARDDVGAAGPATGRVDSPFSVPREVPGPDAGFVLVEHHLAPLLARVGDVDLDRGLAVAGAAGASGGRGASMHLARLRDLDRLHSAQAFVRQRLVENCGARGAGTLAALPGLVGGRVAGESRRA